MSVAKFATGTRQDVVDVSSCCTTGQLYQLRTASQPVMRDSLAINCVIRFDQVGDPTIRRSQRAGREKTEIKL